MDHILSLLCLMKLGQTGSLMGLLHKNIITFVCFENIIALDALKLNFLLSLIFIQFF